MSQTESQEIIKLKGERDREREREIVTESFINGSHHTHLRVGQSISFQPYKVVAFPQQLLQTNINNLSLISSTLQFKPASHTITTICILITFKNQNFYFSFFGFGLCWRNIGGFQRILIEREEGMRDLRIWVRNWKQQYICFGNLGG